MAELFGDCAVNLKTAKKFRILALIPAFFLLKACINDYIDEIELDFTGGHYTTQPFMHELLGKPVHEFGEWVYDYINYRYSDKNVFEVICKSYRTMPKNHKELRDYSSINTGQE